ncbi:Uncharacterised protein [Mycobacteroides abscessus subsp. abscessus]|uniref:Uncharacterized protein n=3 Tax=Mycobacteroides abscessus TaxID=36809 RepID=A0A829QGA1_9MYCO|nr:hypothetical protein MA6G0125S_3747 [Mycobacteroides abscessus 6G-0125-S]EIU38948.1 hypothetical protein MA6G0125R_2705 [Mycobacteroides abscessus 6G-0125-R]EIU53207.1 hypothetical protein MA6G0728S_3430 [Mycobacteroides abscessus 6G-0728-S]EIU55331.1 hypothetical protein MA6G1108_3672 [Mycobacteroides abscessus 6G-1108]EIU88773.1 hypothetical protein MA6G0212_3732 [Mycobacteroides abscessus 6G-0212]EIU94864.1 hypothetical protein MA6G0728R_3675 [Mycobacteroides abscessus 6G-0728-R]EIV2276
MAFLGTDVLGILPVNFDGNEYDRSLRRTLSGVVIDVKRSDVASVNS